MTKVSCHISEENIVLSIINKLATQGTQDEEKQNKNENTICIGHHYAQANTNDVNKT